MSQSFNDRMHAVNQRLRYYEFKQRIQEHIRKDVQTKQEPTQDSNCNTNNLLYSEHGK